MKSTARRRIQNGLPDLAPFGKNFALTNPSRQLIPTAASYPPAPPSAATTTHQKVWGQLGDSQSVFSCILLHHASKGALCTFANDNADFTIHRAQPRRHQSGFDPRHAHQSESFYKLTHKLSHPDSGLPGEKPKKKLAVWNLEQLKQDADQQIYK
jgi:hypothetical protein